MAGEVETEIALQADTRKDILSQQFDEIEPTPAPPAKESVTTGERQRDETGKFVSKEAKAPGTGEAPPPQGISTPVVEPAWNKPPKSWKKDLHPLWETADPKLKEYAFQREEEMSNGVMPLKEKAAFADRMSEVMKPYMPTIQGLGIDAPTAVQALMKADYTLRNSPPDQKRAYLMQLARQYGVDLSGAQSDPNAPPIDPMVYNLQNELVNIRGQFQTFQQQQEAITMAAVNAEISKFAADHEHYAALENSMAQLLQSGIVKRDGRPHQDVLDEAYEKAIRLDSGLFETIQQGKQADAASTRIATADKAAKAAKAAAVSVKSSTPGATIATKAQDRRSMIAEQFDNLRDRL